ncbi:N,N-dimethylformamidase beta subunit family domain-containing protein [Brucella sp. BE17]|uniref:N,N-dimethylformamidase beta subunit family domain-containing protein n=1 Tax=Brucella sp. BE17 TaxID=3142977 RepID=UPI0031BA8575
MPTAIKPHQIMGYSDRLSARAGEELNFYISAPNGSYEAEVWRIQSIDDREGAPGKKLFRVEAPLAKSYPGKLQLSSIGSYLTFQDERGLLCQRETTISFAFLPTILEGRSTQTLLSIGRALALRIENAKLQLVIAGRVVGELSQTLSTLAWYRVVITLEGSVIRIALRSVSRASYSLPLDVMEYTNADSLLGHEKGQIVILAAEQRETIVANHFTGKIASLSLASGAANASQVSQILRGNDLSNVLGTAVWAAWSFGVEPRRFDISNQIEGGPTATLVNAPMRAVTGPEWSGRHNHYKIAPHEYDAILFHADMVAGGDWEKSLSLPIGDSWKSGVYALKIFDGGAEDWIPFYVRPSINSRKARAVFLAPTNTYLAYGNETNSLSEIGVAELSLMKNEPVEPQAADLYVACHPELGLSIYDNHLDGAGVAYVSRLRPMLNFRPFHRNWLNNSYRHFPADFYLLDWLTEQGFEFDVLTDEDLHLEGRSALDGYKVVITGSHPEYVSERMLDAIQDYVGDGGNLMYLGGNGFYWTTTYHPDRPDMIEVRRGYTGARNWTSPPGEVVHAFSGEEGGLWRNKGRSPHRLTGIGMGAVGWGRASPYKISETARSGPRAWIFNNVESDLLGEDGMMLGGAAGDEIDHTDYLHGTPAATEVLASSINHSEYFQPVIEDYTNMLPQQGGSKNPLVRADLTWLDISGGGAVFSVGSICWIGCLPMNGYDNPVSTLTANVVRHFVTSE